jgi:ABC-type nickel/cobalt efflux system permease component RcnA
LEPFKIAALALWIASLSLATVRNASAHPLGNFTINHLARIDARGDRLRVHYVLDIAEIPTFQIMHAAGWTPARARAWQDEEAELVARDFRVQVNGAPLALRSEGASERTRPGAGGLPTLYWTGEYSGAVPSQATVVVRDLVYADRRIGWKDVVLPGMAEPTDGLRSYPSALIGSPRQNSEASFSVMRGRVSDVRVTGDSAPGWGAASLVRSSALSDLVMRRDQTPLWILFTVLAAFGLGALHGLEPGHGKALLAFTLVGSRATLKQAAILAGALTFAHTVAVLVLGLLLLVVSGFATETLFTWITLVSGIAVTAIGARSFTATLLHRYQHAHGHAHDHAHTHHDADHSHAIPGSAPLHFPSAVVAAMSGGIAPCPAAIVVLLTALHLHRVGYGLALIVIFSLGLASVLAGLGFAVVRGAAWLSRRSVFERAVRVAPFITATVITIIGAGMLAQGLIQQGMSASVPAVLALVLGGVAVFAVLSVFLSTRSTHHALAIKETT